jgi:proteasome activator subunit 4
LESGTTASQSKSLSYLFPVLSEFSWRDKITLDQVTNKLLKYMAHPYQQVRDIIATNLTLPFRFTWNPTRDPTTQRPILSDRPLQPDSALSEFLNNAALEFERLKHEAYRVTQVGNGDSQVNDSTQPQPRVSKEEAALKSFSRTFTTWLQHLMIMGSSMAIIPYMDVLVPTLASIYADSNDVELQGMSGKTFITISSSLFPKSNVQQVMGLIMQIESAMALTSSVQEGSTLAATANWRVRLALLMFIQSFAFRHQFYLLDKEQEDMFYQQLMTLLKDRSVEVREQACTTLAGFIKIANDSKLAELVDHFEKASVNPLAPLKRKKKSTQPSSPAPSNTTKFDAHYAVLGLSALIRAYPYDVPEFLPRLMVRLADFQHYKTVKGGDDEVAVSAQVINETVRKTFSNFWRTHRDTWHIHKSKFDEDQLYVVTQLLVSPIYYA